jgi:hypothetical protein
MNTVLLSSTFEIGTKIGVFTNWFFVIVMVVMLIFVMAKYLGPKKEN